MHVQIVNQSYPGNNLYITPDKSVTNIKYEPLDNPDYPDYYSNITFEYSNKENEIISVGDKVPVSLSNGTYHTFYKANYINAYDSDIVVQEFIRNDTCDFLVHTISDDDEYQANYKFETYLCNSFISRDFSSIYLVYRWFPSNSFELLDKFLRKNTSFTNMQKINRFNIYEFSFPHIYKKDIERFITGKFTSFSVKFQDSLFRFLGENRKNSYYYKLFTNSEDLVLKTSKELNLSVEELRGIPLRSKPNLQEILWTTKKQKKL